MSGIEGAEPLAPTTDAMRRDMLAADNATLRQTCEEFRLMLKLAEMQLATTGNEIDGRMAVRIMDLLKGHAK